MIEKDERFTLAERYVEETGVSVFLTGKAGTGKTTFLKEIVRQTSKRLAVVAPTGICEPGKSCGTWLPQELRPSTPAE